MFARGHLEQPFGRRHRGCVWARLPPHAWRSEFNFSHCNLSRLHSVAVTSMRTTTGTKHFCNECSGLKDQCNSLLSVSYRSLTQPVW